MELLLQKKANINALNNGECSTLHVAVNKQHLDCVRVLLKHRANVNIQVGDSIHMTGAQLAISTYHCSNMCKNSYGRKWH